MFRRCLAVLAAVALALTAVPGTSAADPGADARARLAALARKVDAAEAREAVLTDRLRRLDRDLSATERALAGVRARYAARARAAYESGVGTDVFVVALTAQDPATLVERLELFAAVTRNDEALVRQGAALRRRLRDQRREADEARREAAAASRTFASGVTELRALLDRLAAADAARDRAAARTRALPRASRAARLVGSYACLVGPNHAFSDTWGAPRSGGRTHKGTDVFAPMGSPSYAVTNGVVRRLSTSSNGGLQVYLRGDDGNEYFYAHMSAYASHAGQRVTAGQLIAYVGDTGNARGGPPHVHFEVHPGGGAPVNPYPYVRRFCG
ncbi:MAG TPA: M23 family metallopeptidase [Mycobacteriales bacterium]|nr:M23 family metallopeptidase [Mycobacteriales bacterium]